MRNYECMYIINPELDAEKIAEVVEKYNKVITDNGGEISSVDEWGKRKLAYEIQKRTEGYYVLVNYKGAPEFVKELERLMGIDENIMKYLVINKEN